jgi:hypothetical protein
MIGSRKKIFPVNGNPRYKCRNKKIQLDILALFAEFGLTIAPPLPLKAIKLQHNHNLH